MEEEEKTLLVADKPDGEQPKRGKILTLLLPPETQSSDGKEGKKDKTKPPTKVVIRRLPPRLTKETFIQEFSPLPPHDYVHFVRGDLSLGLNAFSRGYINFLNQDDIFSFKERFDDQVIKDEKGKEYHAVVEFASFQKVPKKSAQKKKVSKAGTLESDPKYLEFLQKLEEAKNNASNTSEYFHETEGITSKIKITTTPLLEFLKQKKQKKIDLRNELRHRKREAEKDRRRKEEEKRKSEREKKVKEEKTEKKFKTFEDKKNDGKERREDKGKKEKKEDRSERSERSERKDSDNDVFSEANVYDPAILRVVFRQDEKDGKDGNATKPGKPVDEKSKNADGESNAIVRTEKKYSDFRTRLAEEKQRKTPFNRRETDETRIAKKSVEKKGIPDEKGDNCRVGNCSESSKKVEEVRQPHMETKSKFRYSEQRNRDRESRSSKKVEARKEVEKKVVVKKEEIVVPPSRRKSLDSDKQLVEERKRRKSFHDEASDESVISKEREGGRGKGDDGGCDGTDESGATGNDGDVAAMEDFTKRKSGGGSKKDPRIERRIRNKDRPSIEIYRPGMGKLSKQRLEQKKDDASCTSPTGSRPASRSGSKPGRKGHSKTEHTDGKTEERVKSEMRTVTYTRSANKEN